MTEANQDTQEFAKALFNPEPGSTLLTEVSEDSPLHHHVAHKYGITREDADLLLSGEDEDTLKRQAEALTARGMGTPLPRRGSHVPNEGKNPTPTQNSLADFVRNMFNAN